MVEEYLTYLSENPSNLQYVRNTLQTVLSEPEDLDNLEVLLYQKIQTSPDNATYNELLIWVNLQQKNFNGAFIQARALDRRSGTAGDRAMNIGIIALENGDYEAAVRIFDYIVSQYPETGNSIIAKHYRIKAEEEIVKNSYPVDLEKIRLLSGKYQEFINEIGFQSTTLDAYRNKALLHAFYLDEKDSAILILQEVINHPRSHRVLRAKSKLDLGDIYILTEEPWESTLLYSQVEKTMKESPTGYEAKLRNAKLSYFKGDFKLAQEHLDILKEATTREISNDAMQLSLLIRDNTGLDSTDEAMKSYASIELMLFQNKSEEAKAAIDLMMETYSIHSLIDELLWLKADIFKKEGQFEESLIQLKRIEDEYYNDVLGDDAFYLSGVIYEENLGDLGKAMEIYNEFLTKYPGSIFTADARKRFRTLRGDFDNPESSPVN
jgi:outer membrane protein assembly factor BamD (BamD/ComL family)